MDNQIPVFVNVKKLEPKRLKPIMAFLILIVIVGLGFFYAKKISTHKNIEEVKNYGVAENTNSSTTQSLETGVTTDMNKFSKNGIAFTFDYPLNWKVDSVIYKNGINSVSLYDKEDNKLVVSITNNSFDKDGEIFPLDHMSSNAGKDEIVKDIILGGERSIETYIPLTNKTIINVKHNHKGFSIGYSGRPGTNTIIESIFESFIFTEPFEIVSNAWYKMQPKSGFTFDVPKSITIDGVNENILVSSSDVDTEYKVIENVYVYGEKTQIPIVVFKLVDNAVLTKIEKDLNLNTFNHHKIVIDNKTVDLYSNYDAFRAFIPIDNNRTLIASYGYILDNQSRNHMAAMVNIEERIVHTVR